MESDWHANGFVYHIIPDVVFDEHVDLGSRVVGRTRFILPVYCHGDQSLLWTSLLIL